MSFLLPKSNLNGSIEQNLLNIIKLTDYDQDEKIDDVKWNDFICSYEKNIEVHHTVIFENESDAPWVWNYSDDQHIELVIKNCTKSDLFITENEIKSSSICGIWWCPISGISIDEIKSNLVIKFVPKSDKKIPTLVGYCENADSLSLLYLGIFCLLASNVSFYLLFSTVSAKKGQVYARMHLWRYYYHAGQIEKALYWLSILVLQNRNLQSAVCLSQILIDPNSPIINYSLSEYLLVQVLNKQELNSFFTNNNAGSTDVYADAMITLGKMYLLDGVEGALHDVELGMKLLEMSSNIVNIPEVQQSINEYKKEKEKESPSISLLDIAISTGITIAALCVVGFFISRRKR